MWVRKTSQICFNPSRMLLWHLQCRSKKQIAYPLVQQLAPLPILVLCVSPHCDSDESSMSLSKYHPLCFAGGWGARLAKIMLPTSLPSQRSLGECPCVSRAGLSYGPAFSLAFLVSTAQDTAAALFNTQEGGLHADGSFIISAHLQLPLNSGSPTSLGKQSTLGTFLPWAVRSPVIHSSYHGRVWLLFSFLFFVGEGALIPHLWYCAYHFLGKYTDIWLDSHWWLTHVNNPQEGCRTLILSAGVIYDFIFHQLCHSRAVVKDIIFFLKILL